MSSPSPDVDPARPTLTPNEAAPSLPPSLPPSPFDSAPTLAPGQPVVPPRSTVPPPPDPSQPQTPPSGYVAFGSPAASVELRSTGGLRRAANILAWLAVAASTATALAMFQSIGVLDDFFDGRADIDAVDRADGWILLGTVLYVALAVATAIVLAVWSFRTAKNVEQFGGLRIGSGMAAGGWFIPIGNLWVPFVRLRRAATRVDASTTSISRWQGFWVANLVLERLASSAFEVDSLEVDEILATLRTEATFAAFTTMLLAAAAVFMRRAMADLDAGVARRYDTLQAPLA